jgi:DNA-binding SARP family transcriptional activator/class 3 adenylate cyclase
MDDVPLPKFRLSLLGRFELTGPDGPLDLPNKKLAGLLAYLACTAPEPQPREKLATLLWGSHFEAQARQNLRQALFRLRRALGQDALITDGEEISLASGVIDCDSARLQALIREGSRASLAEVSDIYKDRLLADVNIREEAWVDWVTGERQRLENLALDAMIRHAEQELHLGSAETAHNAANRAIAVNALREDAHRLVMRALAANGRRADALKHYDHLIGLLKSELDVGPDPVTQTLAASLRKPQVVKPEPEAKPSAASEPNAKPHTSAVAPHLPDDLPAGERKHVTALYADIKVSLELVTQRDPEEALRILEAVLKLMTQAVHRYEGTVNLMTGDGIMALFGVPLAYEDHAIRACYAALQLQEAVKRSTQELEGVTGVPILVRAGLNSGEVVIRPIKNGPSTEYRVMGQTTHVAAHLGQMASAGTLLVSPETLRLAEGHVQVKALTDLGEEVYELVGAGAAQTRFQALMARGLTGFVGRNAEIEQLERAKARAQRGHGQVVAIIGEPGLGKSRLVYEFIHSDRLLGWLTLESACISYRKATSYQPVIELLKGYFKIQDRDEIRDIREKVTGKLLTLDEALKLTLPALLALLDVPVDDAAWQKLEPAQRRQNTLDSVRLLLLREARKQPLLLIFEDLHWMDSETQALLDGLVDSLGSARLLLVVNYRPEYQHAWGSRTCYSQMRLDVLPAESSGELLEALMGDDPGLAPLKQLLVENGNPFFLEESVRTLVDTKSLVGERGHYRLTQPVQAIQVPATVQAMLAARIDRLAPEDKRVLQVASVVGKDVPFALLQAIAELPDEALRRGLDHLQAADYLYETGLYPDLEYSFTHALTHEVTYGGLLRERRRELHARIIDAIEALHRERLSEHIERLAHHALQGELGEKAVQYLRQAGLKAAARSALEDARASFEHALAVLEALPEGQSTMEQAFEIRLELRPVLTMLGKVRETRERLREAEMIAERLNDDGRRGRVHALLTFVHSMFGDLDEARASGASALAIAERRGDMRLRILTTSYLGQVHYHRTEFTKAIELATDNLAAQRADWTYENYGNAAPAAVFDRRILITSLAHLGKFTEVIYHEAEALRLAEATHHAHTIGSAYVGAATLHLVKGDWPKARSLLDHAISVTRAGNVALLLYPALASSALVLAQLNEAGEACNRFRAAEQYFERQAASGHIGYLGWIYYMLGRTCLLIGRLDEALRLGERAIEFSPRHPGFAAYNRHLIGDIATHPERLNAESGEAHYREALALAEPRGMRPLVAHCHLGLGTLFRRTGKREQTREHLTTATSMYSEMDMRFWLEKAETEMCQVG